MQDGQVELKFDGASGYLRSVLDATGTGPVRGLFVPTDRNGPAAELFGQAGFEQVADGTWELPADADGPRHPSWLTRE